MKFRNKKTGAIIVPYSSTMIEEMKKSEKYEEIKEEQKELTVAEIKEKLTQLGIDYDEKASKKTLLALLPQKLV